MNSLSIQVDAPPPASPFTIVDRGVCSWNFLRAIEPLTTSELQEFLADSVRANRGTEGEALIIALTEGQLALRDLLAQGPPRGAWTTAGHLGPPPDCVAPVKLLLAALRSSLTGAIGVAAVLGRGKLAG